MGFLSLLSDLWMWLTSPSIVPWAGAVAAVLAAFTIDPQAWLRSPLKGATRVFQVALVFLVLAWLVTSVVPTGSGQGTGQANESGSGSGQAEDRLPIDPPVEIVPAPISTVMPPQIDLTICFVPSPANPTVAMAFACDLEYINSSEKKRERVKIRATNMEQFDKLLVEQLRKIRLPEAQKQPAVSIKRIPFPGENVLRRVREKVRVLMPDARVVDDN